MHLDSFTFIQCVFVGMYFALFVYSKTKQMQHHIDLRHTFSADCFGRLPVLYKVTNQQGHSSSQQCTNPPLIISTIHSSADVVTVSLILNKRHRNYCTGVEMPAVALRYPLKSPSKARRFGGCDFVRRHVLSF